MINNNGREFFISKWFELENVNSLKYNISLKYHKYSKGLIIEALGFFAFQI